MDPRAVRAADEGSEKKLEIGWVLCAPGSRTRRAEVAAVVAQLRDRLGSHAPQFAWEWHAFDAAPGAQDAEPVDVIAAIETGLTTLDDHGLDFLFLLTGQPLQESEGERLIAASSSAAGVSVISLHDITAWDPGVAGRLEALMAQLFAHMLGLETTAERPATDLAAPRTGGPDADFQAALQRVADARVEERGVRDGIRFYAATMLANWRLVLRSVRRVRPWRMPFRLSRLTAAAASTLFVLLMTAEVWELGMAQSALAVCLLSSLVLSGTAAYVLVRQKLLSGPNARRLTEQMAVMRLAVTLGVFSGLVSTYLMLFAAGLAAARLLFPADLAARWANLDPSMLDAGTGLYLVFAGFIAAIGVTIGALGASFERQNQLKKLALVDREIGLARHGDAGTARWWSA